MELAPHFQPKLPSVNLENCPLRVFYVAVFLIRQLNSQPEKCGQRPLHGVHQPPDTLQTEATGLMKLLNSVIRIQ